ncbi:MAG: hypothetical protein ACO1NX_03760 [Chitinophagaceae bacterium]
MFKLIPLLFVFINFACKIKSSKPAPSANSLLANENDCKPGKDTFNYETTFIIDSSQSPSDQFYSIINFITTKKQFQPTRNQSGQLNIEKEYSKTYSIIYDSCNTKRLVTKNYILKNMKVASIGFNGIKKEKLTPGFRLEEWKFENNNDRDSAMKIVEAVYNDVANMILYEKRYTQFIISDKNIFLIETGAKFAEPYVIAHRKLIEQHIQSN